MVLMLLSCLVFGTPKDSKQPLEIRADTVLIDERTGLSIYKGNAKVVRGSLVLTAQSIQVFTTRDEIIKMIAKGTKNQPAHYKQDQPNQPRFIEATAVNITYLVKRELMTLKGRAHLIQGFDSFAGGTLYYDAKNDKVLAKKSKDGTERVKFKIKL